MAFVGALENGAVRRLSEVRPGLGRGRCGGEVTREERALEGLWTVWCSV
jgi:hypothetical protein